MQEEYKEVKMFSGNPGVAIRHTGISASANTSAFSRESG